MSGFRTKGIWHMAAGILAVLCALALTVVNTMEAKNADTFSQSILGKINTTAVFPEVPVLTDPAEQAHYHIDPTKEMPSVIIEGHAYIGVLHIPQFKLSLPVMSDWSYNGLKIAPNRYHGSAYTGDLVICAHNYQRHFGQLHALKPNAAIRFDDMEGNTFFYTVNSFEMLQKHQTAAMLDGDWDLTLFTCVPGGQKRIAIRCKLVEAIPANQNSSAKQSCFDLSLM